MDSQNTQGNTLGALAPMTVEQTVENLRMVMEQFGKGLLNLKDKAGENPPAENEDRGEVIANIMLAYRHVEDARMRLGKVYQALNGGVSNSTK